MVAALVSIEGSSKARTFGRRSSLFTMSGMGAALVDLLWKVFNFLILPCLCRVWFFILYGEKGF